MVTPDQTYPPPKIIKFLLRITRAHTLNTKNEDENEQEQEHEYEHTAIA